MVEEIKEKNIDKYALQESKKKGKGERTYGDYISIYSEIIIQNSAKSGIGLLIQIWYKNHLQGCTYTSDRILTVNLKVEHHPLNAITVYIREHCKLRKKEQISTRAYKTKSIWSDTVPRVKLRFNEATTNDNGELLL